MLAYQNLKMKNLYLTAFFILFFFILKAQVAINDWRVHFPTTNGIAVAYGNNRVYCATESFVYAYNLVDNSIERLGKNNLLTSTGISALSFDQNTNTLIVGYSDGNLDFIKDGSTFNERSIRNSSIGGLKTINRIKSNNGLVYFSTAFGIVVYDILRKEVRDTYIIGPGGANLQVWSTDFFNNEIFAATDIGLFKAPVNHPFLSDFNIWDKVETIQNENNVLYDMVQFSNYLFVVQSRAGVNDVLMYTENLTDWVEFRDASFFTRISVSFNRLLINYASRLQAVSPGLFNVFNFTSFQDNVVQPRDAVFVSPNEAWFADSRGLVKLNSPTLQYEIISVEGPFANDAFALFNTPIGLVRTSGGPTGTWSRNFNINGFDVFSEGDWTSFNRTVNNFIFENEIRDISGFAIDPKDNTRWFVGTWGDGLLEMKDGVVINHYTSDNSPLQNAPETIGPGVLSVAFDENNNLWMSNGYSNEPVVVLTAEGNWATHETSSLGAPGSNLLGRFIINQSNHKWYIRERGGGILVYDDNETPEIHADDNAKTINSNVGSGNLPTNDVFSIAEDLNGEIWVGTQEGICVFYAPAAVFSDGNFDAQRILLEQDGNIQILLETEAVLSIAVDGANRKWLGTQGSGVFLMSPDGTEEILHFTIENSPLPSNSVQSIAINGETGEVFFGTEQGLVSFRGTATDGLAANQCYSVFPNPVRENYDGPIAITGLERNTNVKITDLVGNLVFETTSDGGQAIWNGRDVNGERVATGVYLALCTAPEGNSKCVSKIMVAR